MLKLVSEVGRFAVKDNSMIFSNVVWLCSEKDAGLYHLIKEDSTEEITNNVSDYLVDD